MTLFRLVRFNQFWLMLIAPLVAVILVGVLESRSMADGFPRLLILHAKGLNQIKERLQDSDPALVSAFVELKHDAERALHVKPLSVTEKNFAPPTGGKHDYMSIAPYWWPNPATPNGLPFVRRDGEVNPERDQSSDRRRLGTVIHTVETLALAYYFTAREDYAAHAAQLLRVWFLDRATRMNPHLKYAQAVPGRNTGRGAGIIETHEFAELTDFVSLLKNSQAWPAPGYRQWQDWMKAYLNWLVESAPGKAEAKAENNHGTWYDIQVAALALFTARDELAKNLLIEFRDKRIAAQIQADGRQARELTRTRAWDYAIFNLDALFDAASIAEKLDIDLWNYQIRDGRSIRKALDWLIPFATGESKWGYSQITPFQPEKLGPLLRRAYVAYGDPAYEKALGKLTTVKGNERWQLLYGRMPELK